jgi:MFS family permease
MAPVEVSLLGDTQTLGGAFFALFASFALLGVGDSIRLPASMSLFVDEGEAYDSVASAMSLRSISWKVGQVLGPVLVGSTMDLVSTEAGFVLAAGFIVVATTGFVVTSRRAHATRVATERPTPGD